MTYLSEVLADNPLHYWRCADPGGHVLHDIGSSRDHVVCSTTGEIAGWSGPISDSGSADFSLHGMWGKTGAGHTDSTNPMSAEALVWSNLNPAAIGVFLLYNLGATWSLAFDATYHPTFFYNGVAASAAAQLTHQSWTHLVGTYDGANAKLYVNAINAATVAAAPIAGGAGVYVIGNNAAISTDCNSFLAELAVYASVLSPTRINAHYLAIDQALQSPVFGAVGALSGAGGGSADYQGILQQILQSVRKIY